MSRLGYTSLALLLGLLLGTAGCAADDPAASASTPSTPTGSWAPAEAGAVGVLHEWDRRRSAAWASGDGAALRRLYVAGSTAGERDLALLRAYADRGARVPRLQMQLLRAAVLVERPERLVLRVTERLASTVVELAGRTVPLPRDEAQTRVVELRRTTVGGREQWRMASVRPARR